MTTKSSCGLHFTTWIGNSWREARRIHLLSRSERSDSEWSLAIAQTLICTRLWQHHHTSITCKEIVIKTDNDTRLSVKLHLNGQIDTSVCTIVCRQTNKHQGRQSVFTRMQVAVNPHRMSPFLLRPNKSAQLMKITVVLAKLTVSSSSSDVNSDILIN